jgi:hypothetical protein
MSDAERLDGPQAEIRALRSKLAQLPSNERAVFALACAERTVRTAGGQSEQAMNDALALGWSAVLGGPGDCGPPRASLQQRDDLENDEVAAVFYALGAVLGRADDAWWAATRAMDAAFERGERQPAKRRLRKRDKAAPSDAVQLELIWQREALQLLARDGAAGGVVQRLRQ